MTLIDFGDFKIRFDPKEVRINIDGEIVDVGARRIEEEEEEEGENNNRRVFTRNLNGEKIWSIPKKKSTQK
jgi:hypothetical protein